MSLITSYGAKKDRIIYGNFKVISPDEILMFRCDERKAGWYLKRGLAIQIDETTIKLVFQPKGLGNHNKEFGLTEMSNQCVCCGTTEYLTRHHVVPHEYRKHFPVELKSHNFHDVLSMCVICHESYERKADELKRQLAAQFDAPIGGIVVAKKEIMKLTKLAATILKTDINIPKSRIGEIKTKLKKAFYVKRLTKKKIQQIANLRSVFPKKTHGQIVVSKYQSIQELVELWRTHFIENNTTKFLPKNWNIKNKLTTND